MGGVAVTAVATFLLSRTLVTDPATSILQAVSDGLLSFSEREYGMRLAVPSTDEPLGDLVRRFNKLGEVLRTEHSDRYQREILLETVLETTAMAVVLCNEALRIVYANGAARDLFGGGRKLDGEDFHAILAARARGVPRGDRARDRHHLQRRDGGRRPAATARGRRHRQRARDVPPGAALLPAQHAAAHPVHPQAADARDPAQGGGHLEADHPGRSATRSTTRSRRSRR